MAKVKPKITSKNVIFENMIFAQIGRFGKFRFKKIFDF